MLCDDGVPNDGALDHGMLDDDAFNDGTQTTNPPLMALPPTSPSPTAPLMRHLYKASYYNTSYNVALQCMVVGGTEAFNGMVVL